jgi:cytoskeleton protein RodZ
MVEIGTTLQQARIGQGLTLAHISSVTKLSSHVLQLIEANEFDRLPGGLLTRGYLRAFASEVGLEPEEIVSDYRAQFESASVENDLFKLRTSYQDTKSSASHAGVMLIIGLAIMIYFVYPGPVPRATDMDMAADTADVDMGGATAISTAVAASAPRAAQSASSPVAAADSDGVQIELRPHAECWLSAVADGRLVIYRLMQAGEHATINARDEILLRVGDAGALTYFVNGEVGRSLGDEGEAVSVRITSDNSGSWLTHDL